MSGEVVLVTGASRGLGRALAHGFAARGCSLALVARSAPALAELAAQLAPTGVPVHVVVADVAREEEAERAVSSTVEKLHGLDVMVANAGVFQTAPLLDCPTELWQRTLDVNLSGTFFCDRAAARAMVARGKGGTIVQVASVAARVGYPTSGAYCASKFGVLGLGEAVREELRPHGISLLTVMPGAIDTDLWDTSGIELSEAGMDRTTMMRAEDVARAIVHATLDFGTAVPEQLVLRPRCGG